MDGRIEKCRHWAKQVIKQTKSSQIFEQAAKDPKIVFYGVAFLAVLAWLFFRATRLLKNPKPSRAATPDLEKPATKSFKTPQRKHGGKMQSPKC